MSYRRLLEVWKKERESSDIQGIPAGFIQEMREYINVLNKTPTESDTLMGSIIQKERVYASQMLKDLVDKRLEKILNSELNGLPLDANALTPEEQKLYSNIRQLLAGYKQGVELPEVEEIQPQPRPPSVDSAKSQEVIKPPSGRDVEMVVVRFLQSLPAIMGIDMRAYGPFDKEDVASIPRENALNLIRRGIAKWVEIEL
jgi:DNA replication initiation complex subunit (GINS family)